MRLIDADALEEHKFVGNEFIRNDYQQGWNDAIDAIIDNAPTIEERPKGKWIEVDVRNCHATLKCSICDRVIEPSFTFGDYSYEDIKTFYPYCHCGAEMRGDV